MCMMGKGLGRVVVCWGVGGGDLGGGEAEPTCYNTCQGVFVCVEWEPSDLVAQHGHTNPAMFSTTPSTLTPTYHHVCVSVCACVWVGGW